MKFVADEAVDAQIVRQLRTDGHEVIYIAELAPGITDDEVLDNANRLNAVLITADKDFGELVFRLKRANSGVVLIRLDGISPVEKAEFVSSAMKIHGHGMLEAFCVISPGLVRIRKNI